MDQERTKLELLFLLKATVIWFLGAVLLLLLSSAVISGLNLSSSSVAYFSSAISFLSAFFAAFFASAGRQSGRIKYALLTGLMLTVLLLMLGFLVAGKDLSADGVLSVISFTMAGTLAGGVLAPKSKGGKGKRSFRTKHGKA